VQIETDFDKTISDKHLDAIVIATPGTVPFQDGQGRVGSR
jgi:hypothetical protein